VVSKIIAPPVRQDKPKYQAVRTGFSRRTLQDIATNSRGRRTVGNDFNTRQIDKPEPDRGIAYAGPDNASLRV